MSTCGVCGRNEEPPVIQGMKLELPIGWGVVTVYTAPQASRILCSEHLQEVRKAMMLP